MNPTRYYIKMMFGKLRKPKEIAAELVKRDKRIAELEQEVKDVHRFLIAVDPVHWPSRREASEVIRKIEERVSNGPTDEEMEMAENEDKNY